MEEEHNFIPDYDDIIEKENMADGPPAAKRPRRGFKECSLCHFQDKHMKKTCICSPSTSVP